MSNQKEELMKSASKKKSQGVASNGTVAIVMVSLTAAGALNGCTKAAENGAGTGNKSGFSRIMDLPKVTDPVQGAAGSARVALKGGAKIANTARTGTGGSAAAGLDLFHLKDAYTGTGYTAGSKSLGLCHAGKGLARTLQGLNNQTNSLISIGMMTDANKLDSGTNSTFGYTSMTGQFTDNNNAAVPLNLRTKIQVVRNSSNNVTSVKMYGCQSPSSTGPFTQNFYLSAQADYDSTGSTANHLSLMSVSAIGSTSTSRSVASGDIGMGGWSGVKTIATLSSGSGTDTGSSYDYFNIGAMNQTASNFVFAQRQNDNWTNTSATPQQTYSSGVIAGLKADLINNSSSNFGFNIGSGCLKASLTGNLNLEEEDCFNASQAIIQPPTTSYQTDAQAAHQEASSSQVPTQVATQVGFQEGESWGCALGSQAGNWTNTTFNAPGADQQLWNNIRTALEHYQGYPEINFSCPNS